MADLMFTTGRHVATLLAIGLLVGGLAGCEPSPADESSPVPLTISRGLITASLNRYVQTGSDDPFEQFDLSAAFVRHALEQTPAVDELLGQSVTDLDLALDSCSMPAPVLGQGGDQTSSGEAAITLLDVGDLELAFDNDQLSVPTRTFPDLLQFIVGVMYTADEERGVEFRPGSTYTLKARGSDEVAPFEVVLTAPEDLGDIKLDDTSPGDQPPLIRRDRELELVWEGEGYGDEVVAVLSWTKMGAPWSMTCRMRDDGLFVVPAGFTAALPDPLTAADEELTVSRVRQVAFRAYGLSSGSFSFVLSSTFPVRF